PLVWEFAASSKQQSTEISAKSATDETAASAGLEALRPPTTASSRRGQMIGREVELAQLWTKAQRALNGNGGIVVLGGGPGVGKTRLSVEFVAQASQRGFTCFKGRCYERDDPHPLMPFVEIIEAALTQAPSVEQFRILLGLNAAELAQIAPG